MQRRTGALDELSPVRGELGEGEDDERGPEEQAPFVDERPEEREQPGEDGVGIECLDAEVHDAITQIPAPDKKLKGKIVDAIEKGYKLGDKIIRFPKVVVGQ